MERELAMTNKIFFDERPMASLGQASNWRPKTIANWLFITAFMVFLIVIIGGITRLTESGLSITQWNVVTGILPPLTEAQWHAEFALYQKTTEFQTVNAHMDLAAFKTIFFWNIFTASLPAPSAWSLPCRSSISGSGK